LRTMHGVVATGGAIVVAIVVGAGVGAVDEGGGFRRRRWRTPTAQTRLACSADAGAAQILALPLPASTMFRLRYVTATGTFHTPWHASSEILLEWVSHLNGVCAVPHFLEAAPPERQERQ